MATAFRIWCGRTNTTGIVTVSYYGGAGGATNLGTATLEPNNAPAGWVVAGANDFDGSGVPDLVWADTAAGQTVLHYFGGTGGSQYLGYASINGEVGWVPIAPHLGHSVTCSASPNPAIVGQLVTFSATPATGTSTYAYTWSGTVGGSARTVTWLPGSAGNYTENISARDISGTRFQATVLLPYRPHP